MNSQPKRRRGNKWTPWIHIAAITCSFLITVNNVRGITTIHFWPSFGRAVAMMAGLEIAFAVAFSAAGVLIEDRVRGRERRIIDKL